MDRARGLYEVMVLDTDHVALQGDAEAFQDLVDDLKRRYPPQIALPLPPGSPQESPATPSR
jgi:hypothetical protein